jgi:phospholipid/cholesterol/gamma-HCH transport system ATP-binding protein
MPAPIPPQLMPSDGRVRPSMRRPGEWLREHRVHPPPGSFVDDQGRNWLTEWDRLVTGR